MTTPVPFPDPPREILPGKKKLLAFKALDFAAAALRALSWPLRAADRRRRRAAERRGAKPRVAIFEPFGMGDVLLLQPLVRAWLDAGASVAFAGRAQWAPLLPPHPDFTYLPVFPRWADARAKNKFLRLPLDVVSAARRLRPAAAGALCICPRGDIRSVMAFWLAGASEVRTLPRYFSANDCPVSPLAATLVPLDRMASRRLVSKAFAPEGVPYGRPDLSHLAAPPVFPPDAEPGRVGLVPMASVFGKMWVMRYWRVLADALRDEGWRPVLLCGPGELGAAREAIGDAGAECLVAETPGDWVRTIGSCRAVVSVNTGPMHVADALGVPLVVVDGPSRLPLWAPEGEKSVVLHRQDAVPWVPVHFGDDYALQARVMALVTPNAVLDALRPFLRSAPARPPASGDASNA